MDNDCNIWISGTVSTPADSEVLKIGGFANYVNTGQSKFPNNAPSVPTYFDTYDLAYEAVTELGSRVTELPDSTPPTGHLAPMSATETSPPWRAGLSPATTRDGASARTYGGQPFSYSGFNCASGL